MIMTQERTNQIIKTNGLPIRFETFATLSAQRTTALFQVTLPGHAYCGIRKAINAIWVFDKNASSHDGSPGQYNEIHQMIR